MATPALPRITAGYCTFCQPRVYLPVFSLLKDHMDRHIAKGDFDDTVEHLDAR
jgi:hypothetical protein